MRIERSKDKKRSARRIIASLLLTVVSVAATLRPRGAGIHGNLMVQGSARSVGVTGVLTGPAIAGGAVPRRAGDSGGNTRH